MHEKRLGASGLEFVLLLGHIYEADHYIGVHPCDSLHSVGLNGRVRIDACINNKLYPITQRFEDSTFRYKLSSIIGEI